MKFLLFGLLALSLAANIVLGLRSRPTSPATDDDSTASSPSSSTVVPERDRAGNSASASETLALNASAGGDASSRAAAAFWQPQGSEGDLRRQVERLRATGFPPSVIRAIVNQLLNERFASRQPNADAPFWKQSRPTQEAVAARNALNRERQALYEALLGPDARPSATVEGAARTRRYGDLTDDKIDAIARIERDYNEMTSETFAQRRTNSPADAETMMQTQQLMEREKLADLAEVLTPAELAQYEMRSSQSARTLMNNLRNVEVSEREYGRLYELQKAFDAANPRRAMIDGSSYVQRQAAQQAANDQVRTLLGEDRFYAYLEGADPNYGSIVRALNAYPSVTRAATYQVYQLQTELQRTMMQAGRTGQASPEKTADLQTTIQEANERLESLIGPDAAAAYRKQGSGRMFTFPRTPPTATQRSGG